MSDSIKVSDYIAEFLASNGIRCVFAITGGASIHMIHSIAKTSGVEYICPHHEQGAAMAADAYSRVSGQIGCALATSGPGATNLITGIACSWFDSIPVLYLTGQVARFRFRGDTGVRQMGFQETDIVSMVKPITKYSKLVEKVEDLQHVLEEALTVAKTGRPGPVLVDIPDDLQREIVPLKIFDKPKKIVEVTGTKLKPGKNEIKKCLELLSSAKRPVIILGQGVRSSSAISDSVALVEKLGIPLCPSWAAADILPSDSVLMGSTFGTHGARAGNFIVQNADFILAIGARLSTRETGSPLTSWAREAKLVIVDIDNSELGKFKHFGKNIELGIEADAGEFIRALNKDIDNYSMPTHKAWLKQVSQWKIKYPVCKPEFFLEKDTNPYVFIDKLSDHLEEGDVIVVDTGCAVAWTLQGFRFKKEQRVLHAFNNTPMGYALPAAVGVACALEEGRRVICIVGDGSLMMNLQELATVQHQKLPIKIFLLNNDGYAMVQQTQEQWLDGDYFATSHEGGLSFPDFSMLAGSFDIPCQSIENNSEIDERIKETLNGHGAAFCDVKISRKQRVLPQSKFGRPIEDAEPLLPRKEFLDNMLVAPMAVSLSGETDD